MKDLPRWGVVVFAALAILAAIGGSVGVAQWIQVRGTFGQEERLDTFCVTGHQNPVFVWARRNESGDTFTRRVPPQQIECFKLDPQD